jgi:hypothetical protein
MTTQPGFYPDPSDATQERWWDGAQWTANTRPAGAAAAAPAAPVEPSIVPEPTPAAPPQGQPTEVFPAAVSAETVAPPQALPPAQMATPGYGYPMPDETSENKGLSKGLIGGIAAAFLAVIAVVVLFVTGVLGGSGVSAEETERLEREIIGSWTYRNNPWFTFEEDGTGIAGGDAMTWSISGDTLTLRSVSGNFSWLGLGGGQGARLDTRVEIDGDEMTHVWQGRGEGTHVYRRVIVIPPEPCEWVTGIYADDPNCVEPQAEMCQWDGSLYADDPNCVEPQAEGEGRRQFYGLSLYMPDSDFTPFLDGAYMNVDGPVGVSDVAVTYIPTDAGWTVPELREILEYFFYDYSENCVEVDIVGATLALWCYETESLFGDLDIDLSIFEDLDLETDMIAGYLSVIGYDSLTALRIHGVPSAVLALMGTAEAVPDFRYGDPIRPADNGGQAAPAGDLAENLVGAWNWDTTGDTWWTFYADGTFQPRTGSAGTWTLQGTTVTTTTGHTFTDVTVDGDNMSLRWMGVQYHYTRN